MTIKDLQLKLTKIKIQITVKDSNIGEQIKKYCGEQKVNKKVAEKLINKFFKYEEYVEIELDTETLSATILEA